MSLPTHTKQWQLAKRPVKEPVLSGPDATFKLVTVELPQLKDNQLFLKTIHMSNDPAQRGWISGTHKQDRMYVPLVKLGEPMRVLAVAQVLKSTASGFKDGDIVVGGLGWAEHAVVDASAVQPAPPLPNGLSSTHYLGAFGLTGNTAFVGLVDVARTEPTDRVVISGAAGATGSIAVQLAKHVLGCKEVIGIAGTDAKCRWVESIGADKCINYKSSTFAKDLEAATDGFVNVYFDNVGGEMLDLMFTRLAPFGRVAACGAITSYNAEEEPQAFRNWFQVIANRLEIKGFINFDGGPARMNTIREALVRHVASGKIVLDAASETIVPTKFEDVPKTWMRLFEGTNQGKLVTSLTG